MKSSSQKQTGTGQHVGRQNDTGEDPKQLFGACNAWNIKMEDTDDTGADERYALGVGREMLDADGAGRVGALDYGHDPPHDNAAGTGATPGPGSGPGRFYIMADAEPLLAQLRASPVVASASEVDIISVVELLSLVVLAAARAIERKEELVYYVTDNSNTASWLNKQRPKNAAASHMLLLLTR